MRKLYARAHGHQPDYPDAVSEKARRKIKKLVKKSQRAKDKQKLGREE